MPNVYRDSFLFDSCALKMLWDPELQRRRWAYQDPSIKHQVCATVCVETFQLRPTSRDHAELAIRLRDKQLDFVCPDERACRVTAYLANAVRDELKEQFDDDEKRKKRLRDLFQDILIAGLALARGTTVFTDDIEDWTYLQRVVSKNLGTFARQLGVVTKHLLLHR